MTFHTFFDVKKDIFKLDFDFLFLNNGGKHFLALSAGKRLLFTAGRNFGKITFFS